MGFSMCRGIRRAWEREKGSGCWDRRIAGDRGCKGQVDLSLSRESGCCCNLRHKFMQPGFLRGFGSWKYLFPPCNILLSFLGKGFFLKWLFNLSGEKGGGKSVACIRSDAALSCGGKGLHISMDQILQLHSFLVWPVHLLNLT